jgi:hypothetical protein
MISMLINLLFFSLFSGWGRSEKGLGAEWEGRDKELGEREKEEETEKEEEEEKEEEKEKEKEKEEKENE